MKSFIFLSLLLVQFWTFTLAQSNGTNYPVPTNEDSEIEFPLSGDDFLILVKENKTWHEALEYCRSNYTRITCGLYFNAYFKPYLNGQYVSVWNGLHFLDGEWFCLNNTSSHIDLPQCPVPLYRCGAYNSINDKLENRACNEKLYFICYQNHFNNYPSDLYGYQNDSSGYTASPILNISTISTIKDTEIKIQLPHDKFLILVKENKSWDEALQYCRSNYTHLTCRLYSIAYFRDYLNGQYVSVWNGLHFQDGKWFCLNYKLRHIDLPKNPVSSYRCGAYNFSTNRLENRNCIEKLYFICSKE